jgi:hypothetical protein
MIGLLSFVSVLGCALVPEDVEVLSEVAAHATKYIGGGELLSEKQVEAFEHLMQESSKDGVGVSGIFRQADVLLQIMETVADCKGPISKEEVEKIRLIELKKSGWTFKETSTDIHVLKKYIELAKTQGNLNGFRSFERAGLLRSVIQQIGIDFSEEDVETLRSIELKANGLSEKDIETLSCLAKRKDQSAFLSKNEVDSLKKWIQIEGARFSKDLLSFEKSAALHEIIQDQPSPPFFPKELQLDNLAFQRRLESSPSVPVEMLDALSYAAEKVSAYLGSSEELQQGQIKAVKYFARMATQFGSVPGIDPVQVGRLLQLMELKSEFQQLMYLLKSICQIELIKNGFGVDQKNALAHLREKACYHEKDPLSKAEVALLKQYIVKAKKPGGLNGFGMQERASLFFIVQKHLSNGFTPGELEILRSREQRMNGFSPEEIYRLKLLMKNKKEQASQEDQLLMKRFRQVERMIGEETLMQRL